MTEKEQTKHFEIELRALIDRFRKEYDLSYASAIGTLHMAMHDLCAECEREDEG